MSEHDDAIPWYGERCWLKEEPYGMIEEPDWPEWETIRAGLRRYVIEVLTWCRERGELTDEGAEYLERLRRERRRAEAREEAESAPDLNSDLFLHREHVGGEAAALFDRVHDDLEDRLVGRLADGEIDAAWVAGELDASWHQLQAGELPEPSRWGDVSDGVLGTVAVVIGMPLILIGSFAVVGGLAAAGIWLGINYPVAAVPTGLVGAAVGFASRYRPGILPKANLVGPCGTAYAVGVAIGLVLSLGAPPDDATDAADAAEAPRPAVGVIVSRGHGGDHSATVL